MNLLAVSQRPLSQNAGEAYWCSRRIHESAEGDLVLVYVKLKGIAQIYRVHDASNHQQKSACVMRGMTTIWLEHLITVDNPLTAKGMKSNEHLVGMSAVGRNFQSTTFRLDDDDLSEIIEELKQLNPTVASQLGKIRKRPKRNR